MAKREVVNVGVYERGLFMINGDSLLECDFCDEKKVLASINTVTIDVMCVCEDCLRDFANAFERKSWKTCIIRFFSYICNRKRIYSHTTNN